MVVTWPTAMTEHADIAMWLQDVERCVDRREQCFYTIEHPYTQERSVEDGARTTTELMLMQKEGVNLMHVAEALVETAEHDNTRRRAKNVRERLRINQTRIVAALGRMTA